MAMQTIETPMAGLVKAAGLKQTSEPAAAPVRERQVDAKGPPMPPAAQNASPGCG